MGGIHLGGGSHRRDGDREARTRPAGRRAPRAGRRHDRGGQERAAPDAGVGACRRQLARGPQLRPRRLQGRGRVSGLRAPPPHRGTGHRPRRPPDRTRPALAAGGAQATGARPGTGRGQGHRGLPRRPAPVRQGAPRTAPPGHRHRRVRLTGGGVPRFHQGTGRDLAARACTRRPPGPRHPTAVGRGLAGDPGELQLRHRPACGQPRRELGHHRIVRRVDDLAVVPRTRLSPHLPGTAGVLPDRPDRRTAARRRRGTPTGICGRRRVGTPRSPGPPSAPRLERRRRCHRPARTGRRGVRGGADRRDPAATSAVVGPAPPGPRAREPATAGVRGRRTRPARVRDRGPTRPPGAGSGDLRHHRRSPPADRREPQVGPDLDAPHPGRLHGIVVHP